MYTHCPYSSFCPTKMFSVYIKNKGCSNTFGGDCKPGFTAKKLTVLIQEPDSADQQEYPRALARSSRGKGSIRAVRGHVRVCASGVNNATKY